MSDSSRSHGLYSPWNSPEQNTGVGSLSLLQGIFPTQGSNPGLLHCRRILYQLNHKGSPHGNHIYTHIYSCLVANYIYIYIYLAIYVHIYIYIVVNCQQKEKLENSRKTSTSASLPMLKPLTVWVTTNCGIFLKRQEYQTTLPAS